MTTDEKIRRIYKSINETKAIIAKERAYSDEFQNKEYLATYESHLAHLRGMAESLMDNEEAA